MLKLYTDQEFLTPTYRKQVFPLLFDLWYLPNPDLLERYMLVNTIEECDIAVVPVDIAHYDTTKNQSRFNQFINDALTLGKKVCEGLLSKGVYPIIKHIPGHGRGACDSHLELPSADASLEELKKSDFLPFKELNNQKFAMTAHSPVGINPEAFGVIPVAKHITFANNDVAFTDKTGINHDNNYAWRMML